MLFFMVFGVKQNLYVFSLYRNPDQDEQIFDCLVASMAAVQAEDIRASYLFLVDFNDHHQKWLESTTTNRHGIAAFDFTTVSVAISWLSAQPLHVAKYLTSWWLMSLT